MIWQRPVPGIVEIGPYIGGSTSALASGHLGNCNNAVIEAGGQHLSHDALPSSDIIADWTSNVRRFGAENYVSLFAGWSTDWAVYMRAIELVRSIGLFFFDADGKCAEQFSLFARHMERKRPIDPAL